MTSLALAPGGPASATSASDAGRLYAAHAGWLEQYCARQLGSASEAEDALQTTFVYALRALGRGVVPECEEAWLTTIAKNVCRTQRRTAGRRGVPCDVDLERIACAPPDPDEARLLAELPGALRALPEAQRDALLMREWQGLNSSEIGSRLGITPTATHALLTRARRSIAAALTGVLERPLSALNVVALVELVRGPVRALVGGSSAKAAAGVAAVSLVAGGTVLTQSLSEPSAPPPAVVRAEPPASARAGGASRPAAGVREAASGGATRRVVREGVPAGAPRVARATAAGTTVLEQEVDVPVPVPVLPSEAPKSPERHEPPQGTPEAGPLPELPPVDAPPLPELPVDDPIPPLPPLPTAVPVPTVPPPPAPPPLPEIAVPVP